MFKNTKGQDKKQVNKDKKIKEYGYMDNDGEIILRNEEEDKKKKKKKRS